MYSLDLVTRDFYEGSDIYVGGQGWGEVMNEQNVKISTLGGQTS